MSQSCHGLRAALWVVVRDGPPLSDGDRICCCRSMTPALCGRMGGA